jgi:hypothetical protein
VQKPMPFPGMDETFIFANSFDWCY